MKKQNIELRTKQDAEAYLKALIHFMLESTLAYDMGFEGEAQRLAVVIRVLFEGPDGSGPLLKKLDKEPFLYDNSPEYNPAMNLPYSALALFAPIKGQEAYSPRMGRNPGVPIKKTTCDEWWDKVVVIDESKSLKLTRKQIIEAVANTYGDASVRPKLNQEFNKLILDKPVGWVNEKKGVKRSTLQHIEFASTRHMAWEVLIALEEQMVELFPPIPEYKPPQREPEQ
ncbi:MAG: hypothetical protein IT362_07930 [Deltaproteobacteria bacterium]|nr:hypothetical protein [Deltaproteobacteria bacterium]